MGDLTDSAWDVSPPILMPDPAPISSTPVTVLDSTAPAAGGWSQTIQGGLGKLLDVFAARSSAQNFANYGAPGYMRLPGTNSVVPVGAYTQMQSQSSNATLLIVAAVVVGVLIFAHKG